MFYSLLLLAYFAPNLNPVQWTLTGTPKQLVLHASISEHYKLYSLTKPKGGPIPLEIKFRETNYVPAIHPTQPNPAHQLSGEVDFTIPLKLIKPIPAEGLQLHVDLRYQSCSDQICLPPTRRELEVTLHSASH
ncbi:MAG: hypothetical protein FJW36_06035 [Acidobacteria bacterium]|nr:hypothetical protein [Acidobacteriota bacterium]